MLHLKEIRICSDEFPTRDYYPFNLGVLQQTETIPFSSSVTFLIGENGSGKSTLLEALTHRCGIYIWSGEQRTRCEFNPYEEKLFLYLKVEWTDGIVPGSFFSSQIFRNFAQIVDEWEADNPGQIDYFGGNPSFYCHLCQLVIRSKASSLDERDGPFAKSAQLSGFGRRHRGAQFIIATHSPILLACPGSMIYSFDHVPLRVIRYEETPHYQIYKNFMEDPEKFLK
jgi:predicted ATPase